MREIILDTETTGLDPKKGDRIIEIGCVEIINRVRTGRVYHQRINPMRDVPDEAFKIHGISTEMLKDKPCFHEVAEDFSKFIADSVLVIHNAQFDVKFINAEFELIQYPIINIKEVVDTLLIARKKFPGSPANLNALCKRYNIDISKREKHGALLDAELLADVYIELTGGAQTVMNFDSSEAKTSEHKIKARIFRPARTGYDATEEEERAHQEFLVKIKKPVWN